MTTGPTDAQLVALAEKLGWTPGNPPAYPLSNLRIWAGVGAVVEAMVALGYEFTLRSYSVLRPAYGAAFFKPDEDETEFHVEGDTGPVAILLAAIAALEGAR